MQVRKAASQIVFDAALARDRLYPDVVTSNLSSAQSYRILCARDREEPLPLESDRGGQSIAEVRARPP